MKRILKIVGGPLKGAEIALVAGTKVKVGSGDDCDVLVSDPTLEKFAFELDVAEDEVTLTLPDGAARTLLDFEVREFGSSAFAVGPAEGVWQELVWPEKRDRGTGNRDRVTRSRIRRKSRNPRVRPESPERLETTRSRRRNKVENVRVQTSHVRGQERCRP